MKILILSIAMLSNAKQNFINRAKIFAQRNPKTVAGVGLAAVCLVGIAVKCVVSNKPDVKAPVIDRKIDEALERKQALEEAAKKQALERKQALEEAAKKHNTEQKEKVIISDMDNNQDDKQKQEDALIINDIKKNMINMYQNPCFSGAHVPTYTAVQAEENIAHINFDVVLRVYKALITPENINFFVQSKLSKYRDQSNAINMSYLLWHFSISEIVLDNITTQIKQAKTGLKASLTTSRQNTQNYIKTFENLLSASKNTKDLTDAEVATFKKSLILQVSAQ